MTVGAQTLLTLILIFGAIIAFILWITRDEKNSSSTKNVKNTKSENQEEYISYIVSGIEQAYKIVTVYPPEFLRRRLGRTIKLANRDDEKTYNPTCVVSIVFNGKSTWDDCIAFSNDSNKVKYYGGWDISVSDNEIYNQYPTYDITWIQLKNGVVSMMKKRHPEWEIYDLDTYISIRI